MIFYFSGTGNSRWAARQIAALTGDKALDIASLKEAPSLKEEKQVGFVFPVYAWGAPEPVTEFVQRLEKTGAFVFAVCTCGSEAGHALKKLAEIYPLSSGYSLVMPNNYIVGADVDDEDTARQKIGTAQKEIQLLSREVLEKKPVWRVKEGSFPALKSGMVNYGFSRFARSTKPFYAKENCTGCGLCAQNCPAKTISLAKGRPVWGEKCYQCMRCLHECPVQAIQYGKSTEKRGRYTIDRYLQND